jgi:GT2 family glycosyltransferase
MTRGQPIDLARDTLVHRMQESSAEYLFFLDSDVILPPNTVNQLISHNQDIISGVYHVRHDPITPAMWKESADVPGHYNPIVGYNEGTIIDVDAIGMGCCLIHRRVFDKLEEPYFKWTMDARQENGVSEDFYFCEQARKTGFHIYVDTSIQCTHIANANVTKAGLVFGDM